MKTHIWKDYLYFSRKERIALVALLGVTIVLWLLPRFITTDTPMPALATVVLQSSGDSLLIAGASPVATVAATGKETALFLFDPNTLNEADWLQLGLSEKVARTITHYREKGGHFYKPEDLRKIYGLKEVDAGRLLPYVRIPGAKGIEQLSATQHRFAALAPVVTEAGKPADTIYSSTALSGRLPATQAGQSAMPRYAGKHPADIDINISTSEDWKRFPGIGEVLSNRIVAFRNKMGGFTDVGQIARTYGIADSVFQKMKPYLVINSATIPKLNINTATLFQLQSRPFLSEATAHAIIDYRQQHGPYKQLTDLQNVIDQTIYAHVVQYLMLE